MYYNGKTNTIQAFIESHTFNTEQKYNIKRMSSTNDSIEELFTVTYFIGLVLFD